jgi:hypothetical protein
MFRFLFFALIFWVNCKAFAQENPVRFTETTVSITCQDYNLHGTLTIPTQKTKKMKVALFIAGSGPTDRNGNNTAGLNSNAYQLFCRAMAEKGIATLRYDKLGSGESKPANLKELVEKRDFESEIKDAVAWIESLKKDKRFTTISLVTHSQGTLVGILASQRTGKTITKLVSLAGLGRRGSETLKEQLGAQPAFVSEAANPLIDSLANGYKVKNVPQYLEVLFKPSMQPYLISWFKYDPANELAKLQIPALIVQGTNDIQIKVEDAKYLASKSKNATVVIIEKMNHLLKIVEGDRNENLASYNKPDLPIVPELIEKVSAFLLEKK